MQSYVIKTLIRMLENKDLVLPAMQRPFVWEEERILRLMDSLLRRFPLGTIHVPNTVEGVRDGVRRAQREQNRLRSEILLLREQHQVEWMHKFTELQHMLK